VSEVAYLRSRRSLRSLPCFANRVDRFSTALRLFQRIDDLLRRLSETRLFSCRREGFHWMAGGRTGRV
jgi:hypothetical protein